MLPSILHASYPSCSGISVSSLVLRSPKPKPEIDAFVPDTDKTRVLHRSQAEVAILSNALYYRVEYPDDQSAHAIARTLRSSQRKEDFATTFVALMSEEIAEERETSTGGLGAERVTASGASLSAKGVDEVAPKRKVARTVSVPTEKLPSSSSTSRANNLDTHQANSSQPSSSRTVSAPSSTFARTKSAPLPRVVELGHEEQYTRTKNRAVRRPRPRVSSHIPPPSAIDQQLEQHLNRDAGMPFCDAEEPEGETSNPGSYNIPFEPTIVPSGSYDIIFILDSREVKSTKNREYIETHLRKARVPVEKRALELGDMCWIARERASGTEIVLDFIVERKRMDDLVGSIKDGRFHEQKVCKVH